jgi:transposase
MDNTTAERALRNPVVGRKNYYGSARVWSAHLATMTFSVLLVCCKRSCCGG